MTRKRRRLYILGLALLSLGAATALMLSAFEDNLVFFFSPTELAAKEIAPGQRIRLGGLVEEGSVSRDSATAAISFRVTDTVRSVPVRYSGILPDLFREGQGVIVQGALGPDGTFAAAEVLAKHDENYMPPEVAGALKQADHFRDGSTQ